MLPTIGTNSRSEECQFYLFLKLYIYIYVKNDGQNHHKGNKRRRPKKGQEMHNLKGLNREGELVFLVVGGYLTHGPSNVTCMQIVS